MKSKKKYIKPIIKTKRIKINFLSRSTQGLNYMDDLLLAGTCSNGVDCYRSSGQYC